MFQRLTVSTSLFANWVHNVTEFNRVGSDSYISHKGIRTLDLTTLCNIHPAMQQSNSRYLEIPTLHNGKSLKCVSSSKLFLILIHVIRTRNIQKLGKLCLYYKESKKRNINNQFPSKKVTCI